MYTIGSTRKNCNLSVDCTEKNFDVMNASADASHQVTITIDEGPGPSGPDVVSQEKAQETPSKKEARPRINRAAQQAMFKKRQLELQDCPKEIINLENNDCGQPHQKISNSSQKSKEITNLLLHGSRVQ